MQVWKLRQNVLGIRAVTVCPNLCGTCFKERSTVWRCLWSLMNHSLQKWFRDDKSPNLAAPVFSIVHLPTQHPLLPNIEFSVQQLILDTFCLSFSHIMPTSCWWSSLWNVAILSCIWNFKLGKGHFTEMPSSWHCAQLEVSGKKKKLNAFTFPQILTVPYIQRLVVSHELKYQKSLFFQSPIYFLQALYMPQVPSPAPSLHLTTMGRWRQTYRSSTNSSSCIHLFSVSSASGSAVVLREVANFLNVQGTISFNLRMKNTKITTPKIKGFYWYIFVCLFFKYRVTYLILTHHLCVSALCERLVTQAWESLKPKAFKPTLERVSPAVLRY